MATSLEAYLEQHYAKKRKRGKSEKKNEENNKDHVEKDELQDMKKSVKKDPEDKIELNDNSGSWIDVQAKKPVNNTRPDRQGGLQTNAQLRQEARKKELDFQKEKEMLKKSHQHNELVNKTVHRDSAGRKLTDLEVRELENTKREKIKSSEEIDAEIRYRNRNEAGILKEREMREKLKNFKNESLNVYENDEKLIKQQKEQILEEDPALLFSKKIIKKFEKDNKEKEFTSISGRKLFTEVNRYPLNRFKIKPGWRWDGIVRGNGYEQKWFDAQKR